ncbi:glycosyltransferase [Pseudomonas shirazensis]|uniref:glycosyltransferase n=1 Tax=Pseudomonas shirazensis TaxID=2745494 RepID=UPI003CFE63CD
MNRQPLVTIIIPAFNPRFFAMALQSAQLQAYEPLEILVCDDSDGDEIETIIRSSERPGIPAVRYVRNAQRLGFVANLMQGVELAQGELVKVLCDDDRLFPGCIERQAAVFAQHPDVTLVLAQRVLSDAQNFVLPMRMANARFTSFDALYKGDDMLAFMDGHSFKFLGNFSSALMQRQQLLELLPALTQDGHGFTALLDQALFACLMRRGDLVMIADPLAIERLHPQRLSKQPEMIMANRTEWEWLQQMVQSRGGEDAPAFGWVRNFSLRKAGEQPRHWQEMNLHLMLSNWQTCMQGRVGSDVESFEAFYQQWLGARSFSEAQRRQLPQTLAAWPRQPRIVPIILDLEGDDDGLRLTLESLSTQIYPGLTCVVLSARAPDSALTISHRTLQADWLSQVNQEVQGLFDDDWIYLLRAGDKLTESALLILAERIAIFPELASLYSDESAWRDQCSVEPVFKPGFNIDLMRSYPYVGRALAFSCKALHELGGFDPAFAELAPHDLLWRLVEQRGPQVIEHIAEIQLHSTFSYAQWLSQPLLPELNTRLLEAHLTRLDVPHQISSGDLPLLHRVRYLHPTQPKVSIVVVCGQDLANLQRSLQSIIECTTYPAYEVLVAAGGYVDPATNTWLDAIASVGGGILRVLRLPSSKDAAFLFNVAAKHTTGDYLVKFSPGVAVLEADWLSELVQHAQRPEAGIVGCMIVDHFDKVVEAGVVLGIGQSAGFAFVGDDSKGRGYLQRLQTVQNWSAVSGNCMMIRKTLFEDLGGLDAQQLSAGLAEVDLCLKAKAAGYLVVWTPYVRLRALGGDVQVERRAGQDLEQRTFSDRWLGAVINDSAYNPNLNLGTADFSLEPTVRGSWSPLLARITPSILCLPINASAVGHYRVTQPFIELERAGRVVGHIAYESPGTVKLARMAPDVLVMQLRYTVGSALDIERIARVSNARRVFEMDDYVLAAPEKNVHARNTPVDIEKRLRECISLCDRMVVTTDALANSMSSMHRDIRVVRNMLAPHLWVGLHSRRATSAKPRVGWAGGTSHAGDLEVIAEVVRELANQVDWVFFGMCPQHLLPYVHEYHPAIGLEEYPAKLASLDLDLALAPLEFHIFNDCKSNLRLLEYGACRYPVICSDTEAYRGDLPCTRVRDNTTSQWLEAIRMHLGDPDASYKLGDELHQRVMQDYVLRGSNLDQWEWGWLAD